MINSEFIVNIAREIAIMTCFAISIAFLAQDSIIEKQTDTDKFEIFSTKMPAGTTWVNQDAKKHEFVREGGFSDSHPNYIYVGGPGEAYMTGLSIPIRENPAKDQYRYMTFTWVKWGGTQIAIQLIVKPDGALNKQVGLDYNYTYMAGSYEGKNEYTIDIGMSIAKRVAGNWVVNVRDLWKDFGDFTITGVKFICPQRRDAGFDEIFLAKTLEDLGNGPKLLPTKVAKSVAIAEKQDEMEEKNIENKDTETNSSSNRVDIDWVGQIKAGGFMMYPLYFLALLALVIAIQRILILRTDKVVPKELCHEVNNALKKNDITTAFLACEKYPSTLASSLSYIFKYHDAGKEAVAEVAGDIASRDIKTHLARIYPISIISSLAPLLGLLGTVVGMIEAFGLVALYGDEGGAAILSDSISKALITTAAGLIIAVPSISIYFYIKNRISNLASALESEIEQVLTQLFMESCKDKNVGDKT